MTAELPALIEKTTEELKHLLVQYVARTAENLLMIARIATELESRQVDLSQFRLWASGYLRGIAEGIVAPEAVIRFCEVKRLLDRVACLPVPLQLQLASGEPVPLVMASSEGYEEKKVDPLKLDGKLIYQVFETGKIRTPDEQIKWLNTHRKRTPVKRGRREPVADVNAEDVVVAGSITAQDEQDEESIAACYHAAELIRMLRENTVSRKAKVDDQFTTLMGLLGARLMSTAENTGLKHQIAKLLRGSGGGTNLKTIIQKVGAPQEEVEEALLCDWFKASGTGYYLTNEGRRAIAG